MAKKTTIRNAPLLNAVEPQLYVADVRKSCAYFAKLGFSVAFEYGEPPHYAQVVRDAVRLNLRAVREPVFVGDVREREELLCASITVATASEIDRLFAAFEAAGVRFHQRLRDEPWGARSFVVADPDGNLILFAGAIDERDREAETAG